LKAAVADLPKTDRLFGELPRDADIGTLEKCLTVVIVAKIRTTKKTPAIAEKINRVSI
jgi:hypothetical protein